MTFYSVNYCNLQEFIVFWNGYVIIIISFEINVADKKLVAATITFIID